MKVLIIFALAVALVVCSGPLNIFKSGEAIGFDLDVYQDMPVSLLMKGQIDPKNSDVNKIQTFLKLAGTYIPILEHIGTANEGALTWERHWNINVMGFNLDASYYFQLIVGWRVSPGGQSAERFDVTYTPFVYGYTYGTVNGTGVPAVGSVEAGVQYVLAYAPISLSLYQAGKICASSYYMVEPVHVRNHLSGALLGCQDEILGDLIDGTNFPNWQCNFTEAINVTVFDVNITEPIRGDILGEHCLTF
jgi:hypothetical protein